MRNFLSMTMLVMFISGCSFNSVFFPLDHRPTSSPTPLGQHIVLTADDSTKVNHYLFKPENREAKATLFVFHGSGSTVHNWYKVVKPFVESGYQVFMMEYRGFAGAEGVATHEDVAKDGINAIKHLASNDNFNNKPLIVLGQSYGGQPAVYAGHKMPAAIDALVLEGTFTSFSDEAAFSSPWPVSPVVKLLVSDAYKTVELVEQISVPMLVIHSTEDKVVPFAMGKELAAKSGGALWPISGKHVSGMTLNTSEYISKIDQLVANAHNKKQQARTSPQT